MMKGHRVGNRRHWTSATDGCARARLSARGVREVTRQCFARDTEPHGTTLTNRVGVNQRSIRALPTKHSRVTGTNPTYDSTYGRGLNHDLTWSAARPTAVTRSGRRLWDQLQCLDVDRRLHRDHRVASRRAPALRDLPTPLARRMHHRPAGVFEREHVVVRRLAGGLAGGAQNQTTLQLAMQRHARLDRIGDRHRQPQRLIAEVGLNGGEVDDPEQGLSVGVKDRRCGAGPRMPVLAEVRRRSRSARSSSSGLIVERTSVATALASSEAARVSGRRYRASSFRRSWHRSDDAVVGKRRIAVTADLP